LPARQGRRPSQAFDRIGVPGAAARLGLPVAVAAVDGGPDSYWHRRADGSDALAMLLNEFVPLVRARVGPLPQALMGARFGPGSHDDAFWCSVAAAQLRAIAAATGMRLGGVALSG
jgi:hypothetical protein